MGRPPEGNRKYQITEMHEVHHEITRLILLGAMKDIDIAAHLGVTPAMVSYTRNSAICKRQLELMAAVRDIDAIDIAKDIRNLLPMAVRVLESTLRSQNQALALKAAAEVLDRGGHAVVRTIRGDVTHHFTSEEISDIKKRARDIGLLVDDNVIDISEAKSDRSSAGR
jgi:predicted transcriptional regulator